MLPTNELARVRYERAKSICHNQENRRKVKTLPRARKRWPVNHLVGLHGKPVPFHMAQEIATDSTSRIVALIAGTQSGKALSIDTQIPTPNGFRLMGGIQPGDIVYDNYGNPCNVVRTTKFQRNRECYQITFDDGNTIIADAHHLWKVQDYKQRKNQARRIPYNYEWVCNRPQCQASNDYSVLTTHEIFMSMNNTLDGRCNYSIDICRPVEFPQKDFIIPPPNSK